MARTSGKYDEVIRGLIDENKEGTKSQLVKALAKQAEITGGAAYQALQGALKRGVVQEAANGILTAPERSEGPSEASPKVGSNGSVTTSRPRKGKGKKVVYTVPVTFTVDFPKGPVTLTTTLTEKKVHEIDRILRE